MAFSCADVNECEGDTPPCDQTTEVCSNMIGSYACKCADELVRGDNGDCITEEERKKQRDAIKEEKKKKRKKKKKAKKGKEYGDMERKHYPWYYILSPMVISYLIYKYWKPNIVTSVGMILFVGVSATLAPSL